MASADGLDRSETEIKRKRAASPPSARGAGHDDEMTSVPRVRERADSMPAMKAV